MRREIALNEIECGGALDAQEAVFVSRLQANEDAAYDELVRVYHASIFHVAYRMLGDSNDASDAVQEIFLKVFRNVQRFRGESSLKTWIYRIAVFAAGTLVAVSGHLGGLLVWGADFLRP